MRRLRTDHVDLIQLHNCPLDILDRGDVIKVLQKAQGAGKARYIGYSGDNEDARYAIRTAFFDSVQTSINIADQQEIDFTLPMAQERDMGIIAKRPIANVAWKGASMPRNAYGYSYRERLQTLQYDFLQGNLEQAVATALRFTLSVPGVDVAIAGTSSLDNLRHNVEAATQGPLPQEQYNAIRAIWEERADQHWLGLL